MTKALISVTGQDTTGIIARVATKLSELNINILDITQTILSGFFKIMMVDDIDGGQNVDVEFRQLGSDAGDNTGSILCPDGVCRRG